MFAEHNMNVMKTLVLGLTVAIVLCHGKPSPYAENDEPDFCNKLECPEFKVMNKTDKYELRCYKEYFWASTVVTGIDYDEAGKVGFMRLFNYIQGKNQKQEKIAMTAPVTASIQPGAGPVCASNFTYSFFVPYKFQSDPVPPTDPTVFLDKQNLGCVYVIVYPGFSHLTLVTANAKMLADALDKDGLGGTYNKDMYYTAGYDSPFKLFNRHNEVWFMKTTKKLV